MAGSIDALSPDNQRDIVRKEGQSISKAGDVLREIDDVAFCFSLPSSDSIDHDDRMHTCNHHLLQLCEVA